MRGVEALKCEIEQLSSELEDEEPATKFLQIVKTGFSFLIGSTQTTHHLGQNSWFSSGFHLANLLAG